jgi:hypothetical protein
MGKKRKEGEEGESVGASVCEKKVGRKGKDVVREW